MKLLRWLAFGLFISCSLAQFIFAADQQPKGSIKEHHMKLEIEEEPAVIQKTLETMTRLQQSSDLPSLFQKVQKIHIVACGTSFHAGKVSEKWFEEYGKISVTTSVASEFVNKLLFDPVASTLMIFISQSGETKDTLEALRYVKGKGYRTLAIVNSESSTLAKAAKDHIFTPAGKEQAIAATKSFMAQLVVLAQLSLWSFKGQPEELNRLTISLNHVSKDVEQRLKLAETLKQEGAFLAQKSHLFCLGMGIGYGLALEAALKNKETSYFHAEALPLKELRHGPLAMLEDKHSAVLILIAGDVSSDDMATALESIAKRKAPVFIIGDEWICKAYEGELIHTIPMPSKNFTNCGVGGYFEEISMATVIQLLAYYRGVALGLDVDHPRDLVKAVTNN